MKRYDHDMYELLGGEPSVVSGNGRCGMEYFKGGTTDIFVNKTVGPRYSSLDMKIFNGWG